MSYLQDFLNSLPFWPFILLVLVFFSVKIVNEYQRVVVFRLGRFNRVAGPGIIFIIPALEWIRVVDLRTLTTPVAQQETITRDNVPAKINAVIWSKITDPARSIISVVDAPYAVVQVAITALRNVIGRHSLDEVLKQQDDVGNDLLLSIDKVTEPWGIKVERVEIKNVEIPESMQRSMALEAEAVREKRARLIKADAEFEAATKLAEASEIISRNPSALELRRMQMIAEVGAEQNTMTIIMMPTEFVDMARGIAKHMTTNG
jgi:regulator of protease activity HflC (stomatin/prohibitin superfamily)